MPSQGSCHCSKNNLFLLGNSSFGVQTEPGAQPKVQICFKTAGAQPLLCPTGTEAWPDVQG